MGVICYSFVRDAINYGIHDVPVLVPDRIPHEIYDMYGEDKACFISDFSCAGDDYVFAALYIYGLRAIEVAIKDKATDTIIAAFEITY